jgi:TonB family protein
MCRANFSVRMKIFSFLSAFGAMLLGCVAQPLSAADQAAKKHGYTVTVQMKVNEEGVVQSASVLDSEDVSAGEVLTKMAVAMALKTKIPPQMKDGKAVPATVRAPFFFPIENDEGPDAAALPLPRPKKESAVMPAYPPALRDAGVVGGAVLELKVDDTGKLTHVTTLRASHPEFEAAAKEAMSKWVFAPALKEGKPVESRARIAIVFETEGEMADLKWRIAPRPSLGAFVVIRPDEPIQLEETPAETTEPASPAAPAPEQPPAVTK